MVSFEEIKKILPHRYPFLLVDRVISVDKTSIRALKNVTANEPFFVGHFPNLAVMPGVLQVEAIAQASGIILAFDESFTLQNEVALLAGVDNAKFKRMVTPGDQLIIEAQIVARKRNVVKVSGTVHVDGELASSADLVVVLKAL